MALAIITIYPLSLKMRGFSVNLKLQLQGTHLKQ